MVCILKVRLHFHQVSNGEDVLGVELLLDGPVEADAERRHLFFQPLLSLLADAVVVRYVSAAGNHLISRGGFDLVVLVQRLLQVPFAAGKAHVEVDARTRVVNLRHSARHHVGRNLQV